MVDKLHLAIVFVRTVDYPGLTGEKLVIEAERTMYAEKTVYRQGKAFAVRSLSVRGRVADAFSGK